MTLRLQENAKKKKVCSGRKENLWMNKLCKLATHSKSCNQTLSFLLFFFKKQKKYIDISI